MRNIGEDVQRVAQALQPDRERAPVQSPPDTLLLGDLPDCLVQTPQDDVERGSIRLHRPVCHGQDMQEIPKTIFVP